MDNQSLKGRLVLTGKLELTSPLIIGSGRSDSADIEVLKDEEGRPFIPATSFVGVLKHLIEKQSLPEKKRQSNYFWGYHTKEDDGVQSALICRDLRLPEDAEYKIKIRDGVKIDSKTGTAIDKSKYNYEVVEPGISFNMYMEVIIRKGFDKEFFKKILSTIVCCLKESRISFGAKTVNGFGMCKLGSVKYSEFDFTDYKDAFRWLRQDFTEQKELEAKDYFSLDTGDFTIDAWFSIKNSLIVKAYSSKPEEADAVHIESNGNKVLPGTSIKGAIRNRALRILKTLGRAGSKEKIENLFGTEKDKKIKSRVIVEETNIENPIIRLQSRIKIDRFTGGTMKTALFESMPIWGGGTYSAVNIKIKIKKYKKWEAGLLLLVLKDMWNEDLAVGGDKNIGRGVLKGLLAEVRCGNEEVLHIKDENGKLTFSNPEKAVELNNYSMEVCNA